MKPQTALVGVGGYGLVHLRHLLDFHQRGELSLKAVVALPADRTEWLVEELGAIGCHIYSSIEDLITGLPTRRIDLAIVTTPIHLHADMAVALLAAEVNVLLEKPIAASLHDAQRITRTSEKFGRQIAVGFQYLHAPEVRTLHRLLYDGSIGNLEKIAIYGAWPRSHTYYGRNNWAGRLHLDGTSVLDSPINNAMSHFVMLALSLCSPPGQVYLKKPRHISAELYRIQRIVSFDTAVVKLDMPEGPKVEIYCTHSSRNLAPPHLSITGSKGQGEWIQDSFASLEGEPNVSWRQDAHPEAHTRECMLRDVIAKLEEPSSFSCSTSLATQHVDLVETLHKHIPITPVSADLTRQREQDDAQYTYLPGLGEFLETAARNSKHLHETGAAWAVAPTTFSPIKPD